MRDPGQQGLSLLELTVVLGVLAALVGLAVPNFTNWTDDQRVRSAARAVSDAFMLARSEAIRTGDNHLIVFGAALGATDPIVIVNDGPQATANCTIDASEVVHAVPAEPGVSWGTSTDAADGTPAPDDGGALQTNAAIGWTFANGSGGGPASWILFQNDGLPRTFTSGGGTCTAIGSPGGGGGGIYVSNGNRDYAVVLRPLGTARVHTWDHHNGAWTN